MLLDDKICKLRNKLNKCISDGEDYSVIYKVSVELDEEEDEDIFEDEGDFY